MCKIPEQDDGTPSLEKFFLSEFDNIAQAHFKTVELISEFIKHYLTIIAIPLTLIVIVFNIDAFKNSVTSNNLLLIFIPILAILFWVIAIIGLMVYWYILNLRWDALLYARTINGIRKYFYDHNKILSIENKYKIRVLPQSPFTPGYREFNFFGPVVLIFAIFNSLYFYIAFLIWFLSTAIKNPFSNLIPVIGTSIFFTLHFFIYLYFSQVREYGYLHSSIIGIDIDGVLNQHRDQFCKFLKSNTGKELKPDEIIVIPVRDIPGERISQKDEFAVFNDPKYWVTMPSALDASDVLRRLRNSMHLNIHLFTSRPWPILTDINIEDSKKIRSIWEKMSKEYLSSAIIGKSLDIRLKVRFWKLLSLFPYRIRRIWNLFRSETPMERITRAWLLNNGFIYDRLMVEQGSEEVADPGAHIHNRFYASRALQIRFFVEDDLIKAKKLSYLCDVVFLIDHPYNQEDQDLNKSENIPGNIIRVKNWKEILLNVRRLW